MAKLALLVPIAETVHPLAFQHFMAAVSYAVRCGVTIEWIGITERQLIQNARNVLARQFLDTDCDWAMWFDCDQIVPHNTIPQLIKTAVEKKSKLVTGVYYQRIGDHKPVIWRKDPRLLDGSVAKMQPRTDLETEAYVHHHIVPHPNKKDPFRVDVCGFGCVLVHREVFEKTGELSRDKKTKTWFKMISGVCSEDFFFCVNARKAGYELWADPSLKIGHLGKERIIYKEDFHGDGRELVPVKMEA